MLRSSSIKHAIKKQLTTEYQPLTRRLLLKKQTLATLPSTIKSKQTPLDLQPETTSSIASRNTFLFSQRNTHKLIPNNVF